MKRTRREHAGTVLCVGCFMKWCTRISLLVTIQSSATITDLSGRRGNRDIERPENSPVDCFQRNGAGRPKEQGTGKAAHGTLQPRQRIRSREENEARNPRRPCNNGIYAAKQVLLAAIGSYDFEIRAAATIPVPCSLFPVPSSPRQIRIYLPLL